MLVGGTDGGATQPIIEIARLISTALHILKNVERPTVIYAGNIEARAQVAEILGSMTPLRAVDNIRPTLEIENLAAIQSELENLYVQRRMALLEGIARGEKAIEEGRVLTHAQAKRRMARWLK